MGWQLHGSDGGNLAGVGLAVATRMSSARALLGPREGSYHGVMIVPGKDLVGGLVDIPSKDSVKALSSSNPHLTLCDT